MEAIFDNDPITKWFPVQSGSPRQFEFRIDLDKAYPIKGFLLRQRGFDPKTSAELLAYLPSTVEISVSKDYLVWTQVQLTLLLIRLVEVRVKLHFFRWQCLVM